MTGSGHVGWTVTAWSVAHHAWATTMRGRRLFRSEAAAVRDVEQHLRAIVASAAADGTDEPFLHLRVRDVRQAEDTLVVTGIASLIIDDIATLRDVIAWAAADAN